MKEPPADTHKWIEIDLDAIRHNLQEIRRNMQEGVRLIAVVKANAYGLGAVAVAQELAVLGVDFFGVTFLSEALDLRHHGVEEDILVFTPMTEEDYVAAVERDIIVTVASAQDLVAVERAAKRAGHGIRVHIKVDIGLGRFGLLEAEVEQIVSKAYVSELIKLEGIFTHFAEATKDAYTIEQFNNFQSLLLKLDKKGQRIPLRHCCGSSAFLRYPFMHLDAVRIGTILYGQFPAGKANPKVNLKDPYHFKAHIAAVRQLPKGSYLGYYRTYKLPKDSKVAVIPVGLVDGWGVGALPKPSGWVDLLKMWIKIGISFLNFKVAAPTAVVKQQRVYIRGKIFMQFCLAEIPSQMGVETGDVIELPVKRTWHPQRFRVFICG